MATEREKIQPVGIHVRMMAGQAAYTHVVTVSSTGKMIFVAGQLARDPDGNCVGKGDMRLRYFSPALPTSTTVEVRRLAHPDFMIEVEADRRHRLKGDPSGLIGLGKRPPITLGGAKRDSMSCNTEKAFGITEVAE